MIGFTESGSATGTSCVAPGMISIRDPGIAFFISVAYGRSTRSCSPLTRSTDAPKREGLRHTCATLLLREQTPVHAVSERLGHSTAMTMKVYAPVWTARV